MSPASQRSPPIYALDISRAAYNVSRYDPLQEE
jgi:hypothetical protein